MSVRIWIPLILIPLVVACGGNGYISTKEVSGLANTPLPSSTPIAQARAIETAVAATLTALTPESTCEATSDSVPTLNLGECVVLTFTSGPVAAEKQIVIIKPDQPGQYTIVLENANPPWSEHWLHWDYISLQVGHTPIWEVGESDEAFYEFCDPGMRSHCTTRFMIGSSREKDFIMDLNDGLRPKAELNFALSEQQINSELRLILSTLNASHPNLGVDHFDLKVTLERQ